MCTFYIAFHFNALLAEILWVLFKYFLEMSPVGTQMPVIKNLQIKVHGESQKQHMIDIPVLLMNGCKVSLVHDRIGEDKYAADCGCR